MSDIENNYSTSRIYDRNSDYESDSGSISDYEPKEPKEYNKQVLKLNPRSLQDVLKYPLKHTWAVYDHVKGDSNTYEQNTRCLGTIRSVIEFWQFFNHYKNPSDIFNNGICKPIIGSKEISSISFFKKGILPKWEDPINQKGAEVSKRKFNKTNPLKEVDENWLELLLSCIGEQIDESITGIRVVDSSSLLRPNDFEEHGAGCLIYKKMYRIELWFSELNKRKVIEDYFQNLFSLDPRSIVYKEHSR